jgi:hypothetical protein
MGNSGMCRRRLLAYSKSIFSFAQVVGVELSDVNAGERPMRLDIQVALGRIFNMIDIRRCVLPISEHLRRIKNSDIQFAFPEMFDGSDQDEVMASTVTHGMFLFVVLD